MTWSISDLDAAMASANEYFLRLGNDASEFRGFGESRGAAPSAWSTADGLLGLVFTGSAPESGLAKESASILARTQDRRTGSWKAHGTPSADATAMSLVALCAGRGATTTRIDHAVRYLLSCRVDGGLAAEPESEPRVFATSMGLWAMSEARRHVSPEMADMVDEACAEAGGWLVRQTCTGGGWNAFGDPDDEPLIPYTGAALFALTFVDGIDGLTAARSEGQRWLASATEQRFDDHLFELRQVGPAELRTTHLCLPWAVIGLASQGASAFGPTLDALVERLLGEQCAEATFDHGAFPWRETNVRARYTIWSTFRSVHALSLVRNLEMQHAATVLGPTVRRVTADLAETKATVAALAAQVAELDARPTAVAAPVAPASVEALRGEVARLMAIMRMASAVATVAVALALVGLPWWAGWGTLPKVGLDSIGTLLALTAVLVAIGRTRRQIPHDVALVVTIAGITGVIALVVSATGHDSSSPAKTQTVRTTRH